MTIMTIMNLTDLSNIHSAETLKTLLEGQGFRVTKIRVKSPVGAHSSEREILKVSREAESVEEVTTHKVP